MPITSLMFVLAALTAAETPPSGAPTLTLDDALKEAQSRNPDLAVARERLRQAKEMSSRVLANYLPQVTVAGSYTRNQHEASLSLPTGFLLRDLNGVPGFSPQSVNGPNDGRLPGVASSTVLVPTGIETLTMQKKDQWAARGQITQALIVPSLWPAFKIADLGERLVAANVEYARREILFAVVQLYYGCVTLKEVVAIQERLLENNVGHERDAQVQVQSNAAPQIALLPAQIDRTNTEQELLNAGASYSSAKVALSTLLDREPDLEVTAPPEPEVVERGTAFEEQAERERPDVRAARLSRDLAEQTCVGCVLVRPESGGHSDVSARQRQRLHR